MIISTKMSKYLAMGTVNSTIGEMLLELCVTELEDTASSTHTLSYTPRPVVQESSHPYIDDVTLRGKHYSFPLFLFLVKFVLICLGHVKIPGADALRVEFDRRCSTERRHDPQACTQGNSK